MGDPPRGHSGRFALRYQAIDVSLSDREVVVGRVAECDIVLDDTLVSRKHASFCVFGEEVAVTDLGSRNGVFVNGTRIEGSTRLHHGDRVRIGSQELLLKDADHAASAQGTTELARCRACGGMVPNNQRICNMCGEDMTGTARVTLHDDDAPPVFDDGSGKLHGSHAVLALLADKALGMGRFEEAERIVSSMMSGLLARADNEVAGERDALGVVTLYALRLAEATQKSAWIDYPIELYTAAGQLMTAELIDELYRVASKVHYSNPRPIRGYVARIKTDAVTMGVSERFLLQRLEGLERRVVNG